VLLLPLLPLLLLLLQLHLLVVLLLLLLLLGVDLHAREGGGDGRLVREVGGGGTPAPGICECADPDAYAWLDAAAICCWFRSACLLYSAVMAACCSKCSW
jgi:hypothetical protein